MILAAARRGALPLRTEALRRGRLLPRLAMAATCSAGFDVASGQAAVTIAVVFNGSTCDITMARP